MTHRLSRLLAASLLLALLGMLGGCDERPVTWAIEPNWDGTRCSYCGEVLGDRLRSAQVRVPGTGGKSAVYFFDDIGCAVLRLHDHPETDTPDTLIWVSDWRSGVWLDARTAFYIPGLETPLGYGIGAQWEPSPKGLSFEQARAMLVAAGPRKPQR